MPSNKSQEQFPGLRQKFLKVFMPVVLILALGTVVSYAWMNKRSSSSSLRHTALLASPSPEQQERVETELVTITTTGFDPVQITRPRGKFHLEVDNRSATTVELRLDGPGQEAIKSATVDLNTLEWNEELDLAPGEYVLRAPAHSNWICRLTISAN